MATQLSDRIFQIRESTGLDQAKFAAKVGLTQAAISNFESGKRSPSSYSLAKICKAVDIPIDELIGIGKLLAEGESKKNLAIQALVLKLRNSDISTEEIIALTRFFDARLATKPDE